MFFFHPDDRIGDDKPPKGFQSGIFIWAVAVLVGLFLSNSFANSSGSRPVVGEPLPAWEPGMLDIHQINTGKGDSGLLIFPDGTTLLHDAGDMNRGTPPNYDLDLILDDSLRAGEWIARYIQAVHPDGETGDLDYAVINHFHEDHMGTITDESPLAESGAYRLSGITDVGERINIRTIIDRGWPNYDYPEPQPALDSRTIKNYRAFLGWHKENSGVRVEQFVAGRNDQIVQTRKKEAYPDFEFRNIAVNGYVWTGTEDRIRNRFPKHDPPNENNSSIAFRISYGDFSYFDGGDLVGKVKPNDPKWRSMESALAWVVGPVDAHALTHHGYRDAANEFFLSVLQPRVHIMSVWAASHPYPQVMRRIMSEEIYPGPREVFLTNGVWEGRRPHLIERFGEEEAEWLEAQIAEAAASRGHIVIRVEEGGERYRVIVLDDSDESRRVLSVHGPYQARGMSPY